MFVKLQGERGVSTLYYCKLHSLEFKALMSLHVPPGMCVLCFWFQTFVVDQYFVNRAGVSVCDC